MFPALACPVGAGGEKDSALGGWGLAAGPRSFSSCQPHLNEPPAKAPLNVCLCLNCLFTSDKRLSDLGESKFRWGAAVSTKRSGKGGLAGPGPSEAAPNALFWE